MTKTDVPTFYDFNDCRESDELQVATHWMWQSGNRWVAKAGETYDSWFFEPDLVDGVGGFAEAFPAEYMDGSLVHLAKHHLIRDIANIPTSGTLAFHDKDCNEVELDASQM